jgi:hypothetical protein
VEENERRKEESITPFSAFLSLIVAITGTGSNTLYTHKGRENETRGESTACHNQKKKKGGKGEEGCHGGGPRRHTENARRMADAQNQEGEGSIGIIIYVYVCIRG